MKKDITYVDAQLFAAAIAQSGLPTSEKSGWIRVDGQSGRRLYVPKTKKVGRIDCVGLSGEGLVPAGEFAHGAVTHLVDFGRTEEEIMTAFSRALGQLKTLEAVAKPAKEPKAPRERKAKGTETGAVQAAPKQSRKDRASLIREVALKNGVAISADTEAEINEA